MSKADREAKRQEKFERAKIATNKAAEKDRAAKEPLEKKVNQKGGAGKLTRAEIKLAKRTGEGEVGSED